MLESIWETLIYKPFINVLATLVSIIPGGDVGIAVILLTLLVKIILFPLAKASLKNQEKMNALAPELNKLKKSGKSKEEQAKETFELYKKHKTNPFSGCLLILVQIPIIFALYHVFWKELSFNPENLYSFVPRPEEINMMFLGFIDLSTKSLFLAIFAGISQYFQAHTMPKPTQMAEEGTFTDSFQKSMQVQIKYVFPFIITIIAYSISGVVALYWTVNNLFSIVQQQYLNKQNKLINKNNETRNNK